MADFIISWVEENQGFPHSKIIGLLNLCTNNGYADEPWRFQSTKARFGDRVWLMKQGKDPRGVFGIGEFIGPRAMGEASNGKACPMALVRLTSLVDPLSQFLIGWSLMRGNMTTAVRASGTMITDKEAVFLADSLGATSKG
ncbi:hypothetical protein JL100_006455 [Skermanella mucosa]|uniref:hypothetical protein n=1 Tax=Skermanella mucosa TaxID=1789672 RepID=UPI00192BD11E|nr:hypothetical protein [Skermanella mucosa]UEM22382.1 hypothetical protein JL100_006455 [Skermanella mucosa]